MQKVTGYLASDGAFFTIALEAEYHDACLALKEALSRDLDSNGRSASFSTFTSLCESHFDEVSRYIITLRKIREKTDAS